MKTNLIIVFWKALEMRATRICKAYMVSHLKSWRWFFKVQLIAPSYVPLETIQLLSETFLFAGLSFWDILLSKLKWDILYIIPIDTTEGSMGKILWLAKH